MGVDRVRFLKNRDEAWLPKILRVKVDLEQGQILLCHR